jgi:hypothetical protein
MKPLGGAHLAHISEPSDKILPHTNESKTYTELSEEFKSLYPTVVRAFELIPLMYNKLTLDEKKTHKEAMQKIYEDHKHLSGFSMRNVRRYLPSNNPITSRRVRPPCPNSSDTEITSPVELSNTTEFGNTPANDENKIVSFKVPVDVRRVVQYINDISTSPDTTSWEIWFHIAFDKQTNNIVSCRLGGGIQSPEDGLDLTMNVRGVKIE